MILYSNNKTTDYTAAHCLQIYKRGIRELVCDFEPDMFLTKRLNDSGINIHYFREKVYHYNPLSNNLLNDIEAAVIIAKENKFYGFALDLEAYSKSFFWQYYDINYYDLGVKIGERIIRHVDNLCLYPEFLGGEKYGDLGVGSSSYVKFVHGLAATGLNIKILLERTYNVWKPWELLFFYRRAKRELNIEASFYIGIWPDSMPWLCRKIQYFTARLIAKKKIFYYTERRFG